MKTFTTAQILEKAAELYGTHNATVIENSYERVTLRLASWNGETPLAHLLALAKFFETENISFQGWEEQTGYCETCAGTDYGTDINIRPEEP